ncbi:MAG: hypothetical protein IJX01_02835 [Oscillospiraceae bacterium]|nr:hypothetical protein [Oscillospiraceae bacterium]
MKKLLSLLAFIVVLTFSGCSDEPAPSITESTASIETTVLETAETATEPPPETTEPSLQTYPLNVGKAYYDYAVSPPDHIYNTLGSENGLAGTIYTFDGTVTAIEEMTASGFVYPLAKVDTDRGPVMVLDMYSAVYNTSLKRMGERNTKSHYDDNPAFYQFPNIGEAANFITVYMGYSQAENLPTFIYGASPDIFTIGEYEDPVFAQFEDVSE